MTRKNTEDEIRVPLQARNEFEMLLMAEVGLYQGLQVFLRRRSKRELLLVGPREKVVEAIRAAEGAVPVLWLGQHEALAQSVLAAGARPSRGLLQAIADGRGLVVRNASGQSGRPSPGNVLISRN